MPEVTITLTSERAPEANTLKALAQSAHIATLLGKLEIEKVPVCLDEMSCKVPEGKALYLAVRWEEQWSIYRIPSVTTSLYISPEVGERFFFFVASTRAKFSSRR